VFDPAVIKLADLVGPACAAIALVGIVLAVMPAAAAYENRRRSGVIQPDMVKLRVLSQNPVWFTDAPQHSSQVKEIDRYLLCDGVRCFRHGDLLKVSELEETERQHFRQCL